jgi:tetratricopeptide (TPR) repeat protein
MSVQNLLMDGRAGSHAPDPLRSTLRAASTRIRALVMLRVGSIALCAASLIGLAAVALSKAHLWAEPSPWLSGGLIGLALVCAAIYTLSRPLSELDVARLTDRRTDLKDRLSSAVEFHALGVDASAPFYGEQMADAVRHASELDLAAAYPMRIPRTFWVGLIASLALFGLYFLPTLPVFWSRQKQQEVAEVKKEGMAIVKVAQDTDKAASQQDLKETKRAAAEARKLGEAMQKAKMGKKESLVALQKLTKQMEQTQQKMAEQQARQMEKAKQAGADFKKSMQQMQKEVEEKRRQEALRKAEEAKTNQQKPGEKNPAQAQKDKQAQQQQSQASKQAQQAMQQMAEALANMDKQQMQQAMQKVADALKSGKMSKEEMQQLQKALKQLSKSLEQSGQKEQAQQMAEMAQQMQDGMNNMDPQTLQNLAQMAQNMGKQMGKGGGKGDKDALDQQMLEQLADSLKSGRMTLAMGGKPGQGGDRPGSGFGGKGHLASPMKDPNQTNPRLIAQGKAGEIKGIGKTKSAEEFAKYAAMKNPPPKYLPNGQVKGERSKEGNELQQNFTGDPEAFKSNTPYFQAYVSGRKQAENSLNKENIPVAYKKQVRDYFDSIKP